jgi:hypothetical protein
MDTGEPPATESVPTSSNVRQRAASRQRAPATRYGEKSRGESRPPRQWATSLVTATSALQRLARWTVPGPLAHQHYAGTGR